MEVTGKCHCGYIRYKAKVDPEKISICHCTDCQKFTGSAYRVSLKILPQDFHLVSGELKTHTFTVESGTKRNQTFCPQCGSPIYGETLPNPTSLSLRLGSIEERSSLPPKRQIWRRSALPWSENISEIAPKYEQQGPAW